MVCCVAALALCVWLLCVWLLTRSFEPCWAGDTKETKLPDEAPWEKFGFRPW